MNMLKYVDKTQKEKNKKNKKYYALIDRDGTIIVDKHYLSSPDGVEFIEGAIEGLKMLFDNNIGIVVVSNQSGIGRGFFTEQDANNVNNRMISMLKENGVEIDAIYCCPHSPEEDCHCRKPDIGMAAEARREFGFSYSDCVVIGDKLADVNLGNNIGSLSVLVRTGKGAVEEKRKSPQADFIEDDILAAIRRFLGGIEKEDN